MNCELPNVQAGFRKVRGTRDQIANIRWIMKKAREFQKNIYFCFIDYAQAFDCVDHKKLWKILEVMGIPKLMGHCKSSAKGKVSSNTGLPQETIKSQINNLTLHLKQLDKEEMKNPRITRRKEILKIRAEINTKETKETIAKINKAKSWFLKG